MEMVAMHGYECSRMFYVNNRLVKKEVITNPEKDIPFGNGVSSNSNILEIIYEYDDNGCLTSEKHSDGVHIDHVYEFDDSNTMTKERTTTYKNGVVTDCIEMLYKDNRVHKCIDKINPDISNACYYDSQGNCILVDCKNFAITRSYDKNNNHLCTHFINKVTGDSSCTYPHTSDVKTHIENCISDDNIDYIETLYDNDIVINEIWYKDGLVIYNRRKLLDN